jgi:membrane protease YdiL (CAAX protease family)
VRSTEDHVEGVEGSRPYHLLLRPGRSGWQWSLLGALGFAVLAFLGVQATWFVVWPVAQLLGAEVSVDPVTPAGLAWINLGWGVAILVAVLVVTRLHRLPAGVLASVVGRIRWRWLLTCLGLAVLALVATVAVSIFLPQQGGTEVAGEVNDVTGQLVGFVLVILLLTPLQAAGEEVAFRGYLTQACGGLVQGSGRGVMAAAIVVPAVLFALAHGAQDAPVFVDRLAFGLVAGALVVLTGGLEAGIAMHVLNNVAAFGLALAFSDIDTALQPTSGTWWSLPGTLTQSLVYLALVVSAARRAGLRTRSQPGVLEPSRGRV